MLQATPRVGLPNAWLCCLQAFVTWQSQAQRSSQLRCKARLVAMQWLNHSMAAAFRAWRGYAALRAELQSKAATLVTALASSQMRRAFNSWVDAVQRKRAAACKVTHVS